LAGLPFISKSEAATETQKIPKLVGDSGSYTKVPLAKDVIHLGLVQSVVNPVDGKNPAPGMKKNYYKHEVKLKLSMSRKDT